MMVKSLFCCQVIPTIGEAILLHTVLMEKPQQVTPTSVAFTTSGTGQTPATSQPSPGVTGQGRLLNFSAEGERETSRPTNE